MQHSAPNAAGKSSAMAERLIPVDASPPDRDILDAVITMAALVARADGWVVESERDALYRFVVDMSLEPEPSRAEVADLFEKRVRELRVPGDEIVLERLFASAADWGSGPIARVGEHVAHADGFLDPRELHLLRAIKIMMTAARRAKQWPARVDAPKF